MSLYKKQLEALEPELVPGVGALFTGRTGGVSSGPWGGPEGVMGLNVGSRVGDNARCVSMNRSIIAQVVPQEPRWMTQVHGTRVVLADEVGEESFEADAQWTMTPGVVCVVQVADCLPVLIAEKNARIVAAVHAGWRSLSGGIVEKTVEEMRRALQDEKASFAAWLGPRIGFDDFETGPEVVKAFSEHFGSAPQCVRAASDGKFFLDLAGFAKLALARTGVSDIEDCGLSTVQHPGQFFSYRRDGDKTGRHAALIWIEPAAGANNESKG